MSELVSVILSNHQGMSIEILNLGARIKSIKYPVNDHLTEMTVGYDANEAYLTDAFYLGATCGRVCNRIENAEFSIDGQCYQVSNNENEHCLHGGVDNFAHRYWQIEESTDSSVILSLTSKHLDQGFPGNVELKVSYLLTETNQVIVDYFAKTDQKTPINLTNHTYFSLGEKNGELLDLQMNAKTMLERKDNALPSGDILSVFNTDFDFQTRCNIGKKQKQADNVQLQEMHGFDHCYVLDSNDINSATAAVLISPNNRVKMTLFTNQNAVQLYTGYYLAGEFEPYQGVCLEAQNFTNAVNIPQFPTTVLSPEECYEKRIIFQFETL